MTRPSFLSLSRWCERVEFGISSSSCISPTTMPSGCAERSSCMMRRRASVPIAENMSAYRVTCSVDFLAEAIAMFRYLQKYELMSSGGRSVEIARLWQKPRTLMRKTAPVLFTISVQGVFDDWKGVFCCGNLIDFNRFMLKLLVILKEPAQHVETMRREFIGLVIVFEFRIASRDRDDLVIFLSGVDHGHQADSSR